MNTTDCIKTEKKGMSFGCFYILAYLLIIAICAESEGITNNGVVIPFIKIAKELLLLAITVIGLVYTVMKQRIRVDIITLLLSGRIIMCFLPMLLYDIPSSYFANFIVSCFPLLIYLFFLNCNIDVEKVTSIFLWFGLFIAIQCIWAYIVIQQNGFASYNDLFYKTYFVIPIGATNNISAIILPLTIIGDQTICSRKYRTIYVMILLIALFLCKSRTGLILTFLYLFMKLFIKERGKHSTVKKILILFLPFLIIVTLVVLSGTSFWDSIRSFMLGFSSSEGSIDGLFSGRFSVFGDVIEHIKNHILFGNGLSYEKLNFIRAHNVFLQIFYENGIIGLFGLILFLYIAFCRIIKARTENKFYNAFYLAVPFIFINAMVEETMLGHFMVLFGLFFLANIKKDIKGVI